MILTVLGCPSACVRVQSTSAEVSVAVSADKNRNFWREPELLKTVTETVTYIFIANGNDHPKSKPELVPGIGTSATGTSAEAN